MRSSKSIQITLSGFTKDPHYEDYIAILKKLYCQEPELLTRDTEILCTTTIHSQKCKIARVWKDSKIKIIKKEWMYDVYNRQKRVDTKPYQLESLFYGLRLGLCGFTHPEMWPIIARVEENEGLAEAVDIRDVTKANTFDCLLISPKYHELPETVKELDIPIVTYDWYEKCVQKNEYFFPNDNAVNYDILTIRSDLPKVTKCAMKAKYILGKSTLDHNEFNFFKEMVFYLHNFEEKPNRDIKQIITAHGGFSLDQFSPFHTHVLCAYYEESDKTEFLKYSSHIKIVHLNWLFDCIITESVIPEEAYSCIKHKIKIKEGPDTTTVSSSVRPALTQPEGNQINNNIPPPRNNTISEPVALRARLKTSISARIADPLHFNEKSQTIIISNIFEQKKFYFYRDQYPRQQLKALLKLVKQNSGTIPHLIHKNQNFYLVLPDSKDNAAKYKQFVDRSYQRIIKVSPRWIEFCVNYGEYVSPIEGDNFVWNPFMKSTPISSFLILKCDIIGFNDVEEKRIKELLRVMGASYDPYKKEKVTHVICNPGRYDYDGKYIEYQKLKRLRNSPVKFVKLEWFLDNCSQVHEVPIADYLLE